MNRFQIAKSNIICFVTLFISIVFLTACSGEEPTLNQSSSTPDVSSSVSSSDLLSSNDDSVVSNSSSIFDAEAVEAKNEKDYDYIPFETKFLGKEEMTDSQLELYDEIYEKVQNFESFSYDLKTYGYEMMDDILAVYGGLITDYPEIKNYFIVEEIFDDEDMMVSIDSKYYTAWKEQDSPDINEVKADVDIFEAEVDKIISGLTEDMTTREKYLYLASEISVRTEYDYELSTPGSHASCGAILAGYSICQSYSDAYQYLCKKADLYCEIVLGESMENVSHAWNVIALPEGTYHVDITWADIAGPPQSAEWMRYFALTQDEILTDHILWSDIVTTGK